MTIGLVLGKGFAVARDGLAGGLIRLGVTPNALSLAGVAITAGAGVCYALGASALPGWSLTPMADRNAYLLLAAGLLVLAAACDILDGTVARRGNRGSSFGAFLDSSVDRFSDFVIYAGIAVHYAWRQPANVTYVLAAMLAMFASFMISYTRARAEDLIPECKVGFWQRPERLAAVLIASVAHNIPALLFQQALLPIFTAMRRVSYTRNVLLGRRPIVDPREGGWWIRIRLWRWPRGTMAYDFVVGVNILWLILARLGDIDLLRAWLG